MVMNRRTLFWRCALAGIFGLLVLGAVTMLLWNWLVPDLFNGPQISYLQALGLLALSKIITWGIWSRGHSHGHLSHSNWREKYQAKLNSLDPADREAFKQKMKEKWCSWEKQQSPSAGPSND